MAKTKVQKVEIPENINLKKCPQCDTKPTKRTVVKLFGLRKSNGKTIRQSLCRSCRTSHSKQMRGTKTTKKGTVKADLRTVKAKIAVKKNKRLWLRLTKEQRASYDKAIKQYMKDAKKKKENPKATERITRKKGHKGLKKRQMTNFVKDLETFQKATTIKPKKKVSKK